MKVLQYDLQAEEIEESLLCLDWKREGLKKYIHTAVMTIAAGICFVNYLRHTERFFYLLLAFMTVVSMFMVLYLPIIRRKWRAGKFISGGRHYEVKADTLNCTYAFESERVFTLKEEGQMYCIPKRILDRQEIADIRERLKCKSELYVNVQTGRNR